MRVSANPGLNFQPVLKSTSLDIDLGSRGGGGTPIHKLYRDVPPFRVWFFDRPLINRVSNSKIFEDF